jgi:hypothetical protein
MRRERIDPYAVPEPWRRFVQDAVVATTRFDEVVRRSAPGPLRDHMADVGARVAAGARECWTIAQHGAALDAAHEALDPVATSVAMRKIQDERRQYIASSRPGTAGSAAPAKPDDGRLQAMDEAESSLATRLQSAKRIEEVTERVTERLRTLTSRLNEAVAGAVEVSLGASDAMVAGRVADDVDGVVHELASLRQAIEETDGTPPTGPAPAP